MMLIRVPSALFFAKGANTIMSWQRGAADFNSVLVKVISMIPPHEAIVAKPPPIPIALGGRSSFATGVTKETIMIIVSVPGVVPTYLTMRTNPGEFVPMSDLNRSVSVSGPTSSIFKSGSGGEHSPYSRSTLWVLWRMAFFLFLGQGHSSPTPLTIPAPLESTTSQRMGSLINECLGSLGPFIDVDIATPRGDEIPITPHHEGGINVIGVVP